MKFLWGVSTASAQIEGGYNKDGKTLSIWDKASIDGKIIDGHSTFDACNCYNNEKETINLLKKLGVNCYRFSLAWTRILPNGIGEINESGCLYYKRLLDALVDNNIEPFVTLYHWDLPQCLQEKGGFLSPNFSDWFLEYTKAVVKLFGDKIKFYATFNEPEVICFGGYGAGWSAPFIKGGIEKSTLAAHNLLKAHKKAYEYIKANGRKDAQVGLVSASAPRIPKTTADIEIARKANFDSCYYDDDSLFNNCYFFDPIMFGKYPENIVNNFSKKIEFSNEEMKLVKSNLDFIGLNIYQGVFAQGDDKGGYFDPHYGNNIHKTVSGANISPTVIYYGCKYILERYNVPVYITENGLALTDAPYKGKVNDQSRIYYIDEYIKELKRAKSDGLDIRGYMHWSLFDNLEWVGGFSKRYGLVYTNFDTFEKIPKKSFYFYKKIIRKNRGI